jgi:hypothetical protein
VTASFGTLAWPPILGSLGQASGLRSSGQHISPHKAAGLLKGPKSTSWSPEKRLC